MAFTHLHVHTEYSLLDGACRIDKLLAKAKDMGMTSMAITDHGVMYGAVQFYETAKKMGIKPIIGCEVYTAARTRFDKDSVLDRQQGHLVLLAKNETGYQNLIKIVSTAYKDGFYYKPRVDHELLAAHAEGICCLSACLAGKVQHELLRDNYEGAKAEALWLKETFKDSFFLEIQDQGLEEEFKINPMLKRLSKEIDVPLVATNDVHYINQEDASAHDVLLCIGTKSNLSDPDRMRFSNDQFYLKSEDEMRKIFADCPEVIDNTQKVVDMCNYDFTFGTYHIPKSQIPEGYTEESFFEHLCTEGLKKRYGNPPQELWDRLRYEMDTIEAQGYVGYFLIVWDYINFGKSHGIAVGPGRGSAAGSLVAYAMTITDIDPIKFKLIFERFLNRERVSMPDIDVDFCVERRGEIIDYVKEKYGIDNVSQISTFGRLKAKAAFKDVAKVMELPFQRSLEVSKMIPDDLKMTLDKALAESPDFKQVYDSDPLIHQIVDTAKVLEGLARHSSTHAAGVVIAPAAVDEFVPLCMAERGLATQFTMTEIEHLGLLKMDFLGLRNLTAMRECLELIKESTGEEIDLNSIDYDDEAVYKQIADGNTVGIFQLESGGMTKFMMDLGPTCLEDLIAGISLYRPGPMDSIPTYISCKKNPANIKYVTPELEEILAPTYGCIVYQEQVMDIVRKLGGYSYGRADLVRRAMSKKHADEMAREREFFINGKLNEDGSIDVPGCIRNGISAEAGNQIFDEMTSFAAYAFNKSHAAAYAVVAYQTAWLKCHYPAQFMASLMTYPADADAVSNLIRNSKEMGIETLPPDVTKSRKNFSTEGNKIRYGLLGVKHVGEAMVANILETRKANMPKDFYEFINGLDIHTVNRQALEALIKAGATDCFPGNRAQKLAELPNVLESAQNDAKKNIEGQLSLFDLGGAAEQLSMGRELPNVEDYPKNELLAMEKEQLGVYLTGHPLDEVSKKLKSVINMDTGVLSALKHSEDDEIGESAAFEEGTEEAPVKDQQVVIMGGLISSMKKMVTKKGDLMCFMTIEDLMGTIEVILFPKTYAKCRNCIVEDNIVVVKGKLDLKDDEPKILAESVALLSDVSNSSTLDRENCPTYMEAPVKTETEVVKVRIPWGYDDDAGLRAFRRIARAYRGNTPVWILVEQTGHKFKTDFDLWVEPSDEFYSAVRAIFGDKSLPEVKAKIITDDGQGNIAL